MDAREVLDAGFFPDNVQRIHLVGIAGNRASVEAVKNLQRDRSAKFRALTDG